MIIINLLPKNERRLDRKATLPYRIYLLAAVAVVVVLHVGLLGVFILEKIHLMSLRAQWSRVAPQSKDFLAMQKEMETLGSESRNFKLVLTRDANVTELLSTLASAVPNGLWLERFSMTPGNMVIQGSVVSLSQNEMTTIGKFLQDLKLNKTFASLWPKIELSSVQRRMIKTYDVVDFVLAGEVKK